MGGTMAVQLSSSYLKRSYQLLAKLCVGEMGAVQAFERSGDIVYKWARKKFKNIFRQIPAEKTTLDDKRDGNEIGVIVDQDRARFILRAVHPDANIPGRMWITDVQLNRSGNDCLLAVRLSVTSLQSCTQEVPFSRPSSKTSASPTSSKYPGRSTCSRPRPTWTPSSAFSPCRSGTCPSSC